MKFIVFFILLIRFLPLQAQDIPENIVQIRENSMKITEYEGQPLIQFEIDVKDGFFAYQEKFEINIKDINTLDLSLDPVVSFFDKTFQKTKTGVKTYAKITAPLQVQNDLAREDLEVQLVYQACTPEYCLFPTQTVSRHQLTTNEKKILSSNQAPPWLRRGYLFTFLFIFFAGFLTSLTPCVYPMLPITLAVLGASQSKTRREGFYKSSIYVLGMATTYALLGLLAASTGFMFGSLLSNTYFLIVLSLILFLGALSMFDVFEIQAPHFLRARISNNQSTGSTIALFITGLFSGLMVGPCVGPVLVGVLGYVSKTGSLLFGFSLLFTFALGLGTLFIMLGTFSNLLEKVPRSGTWMIHIKKLMGFLFLGLILYFLFPVLSVKQSLLTTSLIITAFSFTLLINQQFSKAKTFGTLELALHRALLIFFTLTALVTYNMPKERVERFIGYNSENFGNANWDVFSEQKLRDASQAGHFVILDFYADWCAACRELKHKTFSKDEVASYSNKIKWMYFDSTRASEQLKQLKQKYHILGLPTILFFDQQGNQRKDLTLTGFEGPQQFIKRLEKLVSGESYENHSF